MLPRLAFFALVFAPSLAIGATGPSIKDKVPPEMLAHYCASRGVGSENEVQLALPDGSVISGTITCEAADLTGGDAAPAGTATPEAGPAPAPGAI